MVIANFVGWAPTHRRWRQTTGGGQRTAQPGGRRTCRARSRIPSFSQTSGSHLCPLTFTPVDCAPAFSSPRCAAGLNDTGQTQCYNAANAPCRAAPPSAATRRETRQDALWPRRARPLRARSPKQARVPQALITPNRQQWRHASHQRRARHGVADWACTKRQRYRPDLGSKPRPVFATHEPHPTLVFHQLHHQRQRQRRRVGTDTCGGSSLPAAPPTTSATPKTMPQRSTPPRCGASDCAFPRKKATHVDAQVRQEPSISLPISRTATRPPGGRGRTQHAVDPAGAWFVGFDYGFNNAINARRQRRRTARARRTVIGWPIDEALTLWLVMTIFPIWKTALNWPWRPGARWPFSAQPQMRAGHGSSPHCAAMLRAGGAER